MGSGPEGNTNMYASGGQVRYYPDSRELHTTGVLLPPIVVRMSTVSSNKYDPLMAN